MFSLVPEESFTEFTFNVTVFFTGLMWETCTFLETRAFAYPLYDSFVSAWMINPSNSKNEMKTRIWKGNSQKKKYQLRVNIGKNKDT